MFLSPYFDLSFKDVMRTLKTFLDVSPLDRVLRLEEGAMLDGVLLREQNQTKTIDRIGKKTSDAMTGAKM